MKPAVVSAPVNVFKPQRGFLLITSVVLITVAALLLTIMLFLGVTGNESSVDHSRSQQALFIAESGSERALYGFVREGADCTALTYTATLGPGGFTTSGTPYNPVSSTLSAAISDTDTVIPLVDVSGYAPFGRVSIGAEQINYGAVSAASCAPFSAPCLTAAQRGVAGTAAAPHAAGQAVSQNLCLIASTGTSGGAQRAVRTAAQVGSGAIAFVDSDTSFVNSASISVDVPAGVTAGDLLLTQITVRGGTGQTITAPAGWSLVPTSGRVNSGTTLAQAIYYPATGAEPASYTWTFSSSERAAAAMLAYRGVDPANPIDVSGGQPNNAPSTSATAGSVTTTANKTMLIGFYGRPNGNNTWSLPPNPAGTTQRYSFGGGAGPNGAEILAADEIFDVAGTTGARAASASSALVSIGHLVALRPAGSGAGMPMWQERF